jgi:hypothetical protein
MFLKIKYIGVFAFYFVLAVSCHTEKANNIVELDLPDAKILHSQRKIVDTDLFRPSKIFVHKDKLIVYDDVRDNILKVFDVNNLEYKYSFGNYGLGPNEFIFTDKEAINSSTYFEILDRSKLYYYNVTDTGAFAIDKTLFVADESGPINNFKKLSDSEYLFNNNTYSGKFEKEFIVYDVSNNTAKKIGNIVFFDKNLKSEDIGSQYSALQKTITTHNRTHKFAAFYYLYPYFKLFSDDKLCKIYHINNVKQKEMGCIYFAEPYSTDKFIYVMWINKSKDNVMNDLEKYHPQLFIFDWDGNLMQNYLLDIPVITFAVNNDDSKLYAVSFNESDINSLYVYDLQQINDDNYIQLTNNFYSLNILKGYKFVENNELCNKTFEEDGYLINFNYFGQGFNKTNEELESISVKFCMPQNEQNNPKTQIEKGIQYLHKNAENLNIQNIQIENKDVIHCSYYMNLKEYNEDIKVLYFNDFLFHEDKNVIEIRFISNIVDVGKYMNSFKAVISSFSCYSDKVKYYDENK